MTIDFSKHLKKNQPPQQPAAPFAGDPPGYGLGLSASQQRAMDALLDKKNVFLCGVAGTGKSFVLRRWIQSVGESLTAGQRWRKIAVTATTGRAAVAIGGTTIHRWSGAGIGDEPLEKIVNRPGWRDWKASRIYQADALILDEISMMDARMLDLVDGLCREAKFQPTKPFGGLQVVFVGDFGQLPPVEATEHGFAFRSKVWVELEKAGMITCELHEPQRQADHVFIALLNRARLGQLTEADEQLLLTRKTTPDPAAPPPVHLVTKNRQAADRNTVELAKIDEELHTFEAVTWCKPKCEKVLEGLIKDCPSPEKLQLKVGARVQITRNDYGTPMAWVNGSLGFVREITPHAISVELDRPLVDAIVCLSEESWAITEENFQGQKEPIAEMRQFPVKLAWAQTVHAAQGSTLDSVLLDLSETFEDGQAYVALSRARSLDGLYIAGWPGRHKVTMPPDVRDWLLSREGIGALLDGVL